MPRLQAIVSLLISRFQAKRVNEIKIRGMRNNTNLQHMLKKRTNYMCIIFAILALPVAVSNAQEQSAQPLEVVPRVDLTRVRGGMVRNCPTA